MTRDREPDMHRPEHPRGPTASALQKLLRWTGGTLAFVIFTVFLASYLLDEPLRRTIEKEMNSSLKGYSVRLPKLHLQLVGFTMTLQGLTTGGKSWKGASWPSWMSTVRNSASTCRSSGARSPKR